MAWNVEQNMMLKRMWREGYTVTEIIDNMADKLSEHKTPAMIKGRVKKLVSLGELEKRERNWHYKK